MANFKELRWTVKDTRFLRAHIGDMSFMQLAQALNRSENSIRIKAHKLRLLTNVNGKMRKRVTFNVVAKNDRSECVVGAELQTNTRILSNNRIVAKEILGRSSWRIFVRT